MMEENDKSNNNKSNNNLYNDIGLNEKPLHGNQIYNSVNLAGSTNPMDNEKNNLSINIYTFLQPNGKSYTFRMEDCGDIQSLYKNLQIQCKFVICILVKDDTYFNGKLLEATFKGISDNMKELENLLIKLKIF